MQTFSNHFNLNKSQYELDFVDIPVNNGDVPLFIDPYAISKRSDYWSIDCHNAIVNFFQEVINQIRRGHRKKAKNMLSKLKEPNQTRFGLSKGNNPRGRGIGGEQASNLYDALADSTAIRTGFIKDLEECELLIEGISRDKISDISTNVMRLQLIDYTQIQCDLWGIPMHDTPSGFIWDFIIKEWTNDFVKLPICHDRSILLVPKAIARFNIEFNHQEYYQHFVLNFLQSEHLNANSSLVRTLRDGTKRPPYKKVLKKIHPLSKRYLYEFSKDHPRVLKNYKDSKNYTPKELSTEELNLFAESQGIVKKFDFSSLSQKLTSISAGNNQAGQFHNHIIGILSAIFYPYLISPKKEQEIHSGRKRIDIVFQNAAHDGFFSWLPNNQRIPSGYIFVECKNYSSDPANPELDQLSGRFGVNKGQFGLLICRKFENKKLFIKRCRDTARDGRGFIIALDDTDINHMLDLRANNDVNSLNGFFNERYKELVM